MTSSRRAAAASPGVLGDAGLHGARRGGGVGVLDPGPVHHGARLVSQGLGPVPSTARHRDLRSFAQRMHEGSGRAHTPDADRVLEVSVAAVEVTAEDPRNPLRERDATMFSAANLHAASSASAGIRSIPPRHSAARSKAAHASADGHPARATAPGLQAARSPRRQARPLQRKRLRDRRSLRPRSARPYSLSDFSRRGKSDQGTVPSPSAPDHTILVCQALPRPPSPIAVG